MLRIGSSELSTPLLTFSGLRSKSMASKTKTTCESKNCKVHNKRKTETKVLPDAGSTRRLTPESPPAGHGPASATSKTASAPTAAPPKTNPAKP